MFNGTIDGQGLSDHLSWRTGEHGSIQPFVGAGIGVSYNTVSNFHTVLTANEEITAKMLDKTQASLAYQFNAGLEWTCQRLSIDLGYRYFNGGDFRSNNYIDRVSGTTGLTLAPITVPPWTSSLATNELFVTAKIAF